MKAVCGDLCDVAVLSEDILSASGLEGKRYMDLRGRSPWSENDVVLISYGDSIQKPDEAPLVTLNRFVRNHLSRSVNVVHLLPFYPYSSDDGFSVINYNAVHPELGSWDDISELGESVGLMADLVLNHCSAKSEWFKNFLEDRAPGKGYFIEPDLPLIHRRWCDPGRAIYCRRLRMEGLRRGRCGVRLVRIRWI